MPAAITAALYVLFVLNCLFLILVVLLQAGKGDGLAVLGAGGTSTNTILGSRGAASFLSKLTVGSAILFMVLSIILAYSSSRTDSRVARSAVDPAGIEVVQPGMGADDEGAAGAGEAEGEDEGEPDEPEEAGSEDESGTTSGEEGVPAPN